MPTQSITAYLPEARWNDTSPAGSKHETQDQTEHEQYSGVPDGVSLAYNANTNDRELSPQTKRKRARQAFPRRKRQKLAKARESFIPTDDSLLFASLRPQVEALVAEHYSSVIRPRERELMSFKRISKFIKRYYQDPYLKVGRLDPLTHGELRDWLRARPGRVYKSDLELIRDHLSLPGAGHFLFVLQYVLNERKQAAKRGRSQISG